MIPCSEIEVLLSAALDDEVDSLQREQIDDHLAGCEICARVSESLMRTHHLLESSSQQAGFETVNRFRELKIDDSRQFSLWRIAGLSTAAVVLVSVGLSLALRPQHAQACPN